MRHFTRKGYGRIYVQERADIDRVSGIIFEMDEFEHGYLPPELITTFTNYPAVTFVHKFADLDLDALAATCWARGIPILIVDNGMREYMESSIKEPAGNDS